MVCLAVRTLGQTRPVCWSKPLVHLAYIALESGNMRECGCLLREANQRYLVAMCEYHDCMPKLKRKKWHTSISLAKALKKAGGIEDGGYEWVVEIIDIGNRLAHCKYVRPALVKTALSFVKCFLDSSPEIDCPEWRRGGAV